MDKQELGRLYRLYINNELGEEDRREFLRMMAEGRNELQHEELQQELWNELYPMHVAEPDEDSRRRVNAVLARIKQQEPKRIRLMPRLVAVAASLLLLLIPAWLFLQTSRHSSKQPDIVIVTAALGEQKRVVLHDSSIVILNAGSKLQYASDFNEKQREVQVDGEAYFDVRPDATRPFIVRHGELGVKVLGTAFSVRAFDDEPKMRVVVESGRVQIVRNVDQQKTVMLAPSLSAGEELSYNLFTHTAAVTRASDLATVFLWKDRIISFRNESFVSVAAIAEKWYDVKFHFENDDLKLCRFTGSFDNMPLDRLLGLLRKTVPFNYTINGKDIYITGRGCKDIK